MCEGRWEVVGFGFNGFGQLNFPKKGVSAGSQLQASQPAQLEELTVTARVLVQLPSPPLQVRVSSAWDSLHLFVETAETTVSVATGRWLQPLGGVERLLREGEVVSEVVETQCGHFILRTNLGRNLVARADSSGAMEVEEWTHQPISKLASLEGGQILALLSSGKVHYCSITPPSSCNILLRPEVPLCRHIVLHMSCGYNHTLLLTQDGAVLSFGVGSRGQLGLGDVLHRAEPQLVPGLAGLPVAAVACGGWHSLALSVCGDVYSWGWNRDGQLGLGEGAVQTVIQPSLVVIGGSGGGVSGVSGSGVGESSEGVSSMGGGGVGVSGVGASGDSVSSDGGRGEGEDVTVMSISCGSRHSAVLTEAGVLHCWGWSGYGQVGSKTGVCGHRWTTVHCAHWNTLLVT